LGTVTQLLIVFLVPLVDLECEDQTDDELNELELDEPEEPESVALSHAVADPRAMVVVGRHAMVTVLAMFAPQRLLDMADCAVLVFDK
jgi:hypothetical protein